MNNQNPNQYNIRKQYVQDLIEFQTPCICGHFGCRHNFTISSVFFGYKCAGFCEKCNCPHFKKDDTWERRVQDMTDAQYIEWKRTSGDWR